MATETQLPAICERLLRAYHGRDDVLFDAALQDVAELASALKSVPKIAGEAHDYWDADQDHKVGKILSAMEGRMVRYRPDTDALHAAIARIEGMAR